MSLVWLKYWWYLNCYGEQRTREIINDIKTTHNLLINGNLMVRLSMGRSHGENQAQGPQYMVGKWKGFDHSTTPMNCVSMCTVFKNWMHRRGSEGIENFPWQDFRRDFFVILFHSSGGSRCSFDFLLWSSSIWSTKFKPSMCPIGTKNN